MEAAQHEVEAAAAEEPPPAPQTVAEIMAAATKKAEERATPLCSSRMLLARSLVARQEQLYDRLSDIRRQFGEIDAEVMSLRNARYAHYSHYEERHRQQQAHSARSRLITGRWAATAMSIRGVTTDPADPAMLGARWPTGAQIMALFFTANFTKQFSSSRARRWVNYCSVYTMDAQRCVCNVLLGRGPIQ